jgi:hypothetical protein
MLTDRPVDVSFWLTHANNSFDSRFLTEGFYIIPQASVKMRHKRAKAYRKLMALYSMTFGFRQPYQILGDFEHLHFLFSTHKTSSGFRNVQIRN